MTHRSIPWSDRGGRGREKRKELSVSLIREWPFNYLRLRSSRSPRSLVLSPVSMLEKPVDIIFLITPTTTRSLSTHPWTQLRRIYRYGVGVNTKCRRRASVGVEFATCVCVNNSEPTLLVGPSAPFTWNRLASQQPDRSGSRPVTIRRWYSSVGRGIFSAVRCKAPSFLLREKINIKMSSSDWIVSGRYRQNQWRPWGVWGNYKCDKKEEENSDSQSMATAVKTKYSDQINYFKK